MELQDETLKTIYTTLVPAPGGREEEEDGNTKEDNQGRAAAQSHVSVVIPTGAAGRNGPEFIPHLFYSLYQLRKDPNNSANQLKNSTGYIRHRLRSCKDYIETHDSSRRLLSKPVDAWEQVVRAQESQLLAQEQFLHRFKEKLAQITAETSSSQQRDPVKDN